jgi:pimeloyl-ACP methyl ester carboxylesterase
MGALAMLSLSVNVEKVLISTPTDKLPLSAELHVNDAKKLVLFINGDGSTGDFLEISSELAKLLPEFDYLTFFFRGAREGKSPEFYDLLDDIADLLQYIAASYSYDSVIIISTSTGAVAATYGLQLSPVAVDRAVYIDPADYIIPKERNDGTKMETWDGSTVYNPKDQTVSDLMRNLKSDVVVDVIGFTLRNTHSGQYVDHSMRHLDHHGYAPRLNQSMVAAFYEKTPVGNRGKFLAVNGIPHAFTRDGNVQENIKQLVAILRGLLENEG